MKIFSIIIRFIVVVFMLLIILVTVLIYPNKAILECRRLQTVKVTRLKPFQVNCKVISGNETRVLEDVKKVYKKVALVNADGIPTEYDVVFVTGNNEVDNFYYDHYDVSEINSFINGSDKILRLESYRPLMNKISIVSLSIMFIYCVIFLFG